MWLRVSALVEDGFPISVGCDSGLTLGDNWDTKLGHQRYFYCRTALEIKGFFGLLSPPVGVTKVSYVARRFGDYP